MKISVLEDRSLLLEKVFNPIVLATAAGEQLSICMRDSGFEFEYQGVKYEAKDGEIINMGSPEPDIDYKIMAYYPGKKDLIKAVKRISTNQTLKLGDQIGNNEVILGFTIDSDYLGGLAVNHTRGSSSISAVEKI